MAIVLTLFESVEKKLKMARRYHTIGEKLYQKSDIDGSKVYYEAANIYREKAYRKMEEQ